MTEGSFVYSNLLVRALLVALRAHSGQVDKQGVPYLEHVLHVAAQFPMYTAAAIVGLLRDVVEDSAMTLEALRPDFPPWIVQAVDALTRRADEPSYDAYITRVMTSRLAMAVKIEDLKHNLEPARQVGLSPASVADRRAKYSKALTRILTNQQEEERT